MPTEALCICKLLHARPRSHPNTSQSLALKRVPNRLAMTASAAVHKSWWPWQMLPPHAGRPVRDIGKGITGAGSRLESISDCTFHIFKHGNCGNSVPLTMVNSGNLLPGRQVNDINSGNTLPNLVSQSQYSGKQIKETIKGSKLWTHYQPCTHKENTRNVLMAISTKFSSSNMEIIIIMKCIGTHSFINKRWAFMLTH